MVLTNQSVSPRKVKKAVFYHLDEILHVYFKIVPGLFGVDDSGQLVGCQPAPGFVLHVLTTGLKLDTSEQ